MLNLHHAGEPCFLLPRLVNGHATCQSGVTGEQCTFSCKPGFILTGSATRECKPNHQWSGITPDCKRKAFTFKILLIVPTEL